MLGEGFLQGVQRTGADVAEHHADRTDHQGQAAGGRRMAVRATLLPDDERERAWDVIQRQWPLYRNYERASGRTVRIFRLQPVAYLD